MEFSKRPPNQRTHQTIKHNNQMKNPIRSLALGIAIFGAASAAMAQSSTLTYNASLSSMATTPGSTFTFNSFDSNLGTLTAVHLLLNTASTNAGSYSISLGEEGELTAVTGRVRTSGTGLNLTSTTYTPVSTSPGVGHVWTGPETFSISGGQSIVSSVQTYLINSVDYGSYQNSGGTGNVPLFTGIYQISSTVDTSGSNSPDYSSITAAASYTLRYTYTPSGPVPVPEPGQVAASLLLLGGIGAYYFVKRRRKSAPAAA
jgi:hypothetical protein